MRPHGHASLHRPRFTLGLSLGAFVLTETFPRGYGEPSCTQRTKTSPSPNAFGTKFWRLFSLCLVGFLFSAAQAHPQSLDPTRRISQYGHTVWRTQDGIVPEEPPITQTADGYIWMAGIGRRSL